jgi:hypothetical protein
MQPEPELLRLMEELFMPTDSIVLSAVKVGKLPHSGDSTGAQLLKALGAKQTYDQESMQPRVLAFTVKRSMSDRGFKASLHICKPTQSAMGFQIRKSYSLKYLEFVRVAQQKYEHREQRFVEMRVATHNNVSETKVGRPAAASLASLLASLPPMPTLPLHRCHAPPRRPTPTRAPAGRVCAGEQRLADAHAVCGGADAQVRGACTGGAREPQARLEPAWPPAGPPPPTTTTRQQAAPACVGGGSHKPPPLPARRQQDCKLPELSGITVGQIDTWWAAALDAQPAPPGPPAARRQQPACTRSAWPPSRPSPRPPQRGPPRARRALPPQVGRQPGAGSQVPDQLCRRGHHARSGAGQGGPVVRARLRQGGAPAACWRWQAPAACWRRRAPHPRPRLGRSRRPATPRASHPSPHSPFPPRC